MPFLFLTIVVFGYNQFMIQDLQQKGIACSQSPIDLFSMSRDLWPYRTLNLAKGKPPLMPKIITWPESVEEIQQIIQFAYKYGLPIVPYGAGSGVWSFPDRQIECSN